MKNIKIIEDRPELTNEQIIDGMDFSKIKNNAAAVSKSAFLKSIIIKGFFGVVLISSTVLIYKNYNFNVTRIEVIPADTSKTISENKPDAATETIINKIRAGVTEHKLTNIKKHSDSITKQDSNITTSANVYNPIVKPNIGGYNIRDFDLDDETKKIKNNGQLRTVPGECNIKEINKSIAKVNERLYASQVEVSNKLYNTFLTSLKKSNDKKFVLTAEIDSSGWRDKSSYNEPYAQYYHCHPAYQNYPVVNISYEGARLFCEWLTIQYNSNPKRKFKKVILRLPSEEEWVRAAQAGNSEAVYPWAGNETINKKSEALCNYIRGDYNNTSLEKKNYNPKSDIIAPIYAYWPNDFGLYNMSGNVAEMIDVKGIAKGGSWINTEEDIKIQSKYKYDGQAQPFIGFRYFVEVLEK